MKEIKLSAGELIKMNAPTVRVLKGADKCEGDISKTIYMLAVLCNKTESEIEDLELGNFMSLQKALGSFLQEAGVIA
ncbi:phage tail assembly protein [Campylobacter lanienae]|uniref:phage tail assembly protein n=2 Tax=Campylobacter lanienae TaxID=75658 RepID=UPI000BB43B8C|nr:phage tail assembly protein [Campylobacter lanienae]